MRSLEEIQRDTKIALNAGMYAFLDLLELEALNRFDCPVRPHHPDHDLCSDLDMQEAWTAIGGDA